MIMKQFERRFLALVMSIMMLFTMIPTDALAGTLSGPSVSTQNTTATDDSSTIDPPEEIFEAQKLLTVRFWHLVDSGNADEQIGDSYQYKASIKYEQDYNYTGYYKQYGKTGSLVQQYEDITVYFKAPEGIELSPVSGSRTVTLVTEGEYAGYYKVEVGTVTPPASDQSAVDLGITINAVMTGNGSTATKTYPALDVVVTAHGKVLTGYENESLVYEDKEFVTGTNIVVNNNTSVKGIGEASWTYHKYTTSPAYSLNGDKLDITTYISAGRGTGHSVANAEGDYVRYGMLDINDLYIYDTIQPVTDVNGETKYPETVTVTYDNGTALPAGTWTYDESTHTVAINQDALKTVDASSVGAGTVKRGTTFKVVCEYTEADYSYPVGTATTPDFDFDDEASLAYSLKGVEGSNTDSGETATVGYHSVSVGGNAGATEHIFLSNSAKSGDEKLYGTFYSNTLGFGTISYTIYKADEDGTIHNGPDDWSMTIDMAVENNSSGYTGTDLYTGSKAGEEILNKQIPAGHYAIVPDYSKLDEENVLVVDKNNQEISGSNVQYVDVTTNGIAKVDYYLRYNNGGIVRVNKEFYSSTGARVTDNLAKLYSGTTFVFSREGKEDITMTIGSDGQGVAALPVGTYTVKEIAPSGYAAYSGTITVASGDELYLPGGTSSSSAVKNYPASATIKVGGYVSDAFVEGDLSKTNDGRTEYTNEKVTYKVYQRVKVEEGESPNEWKQVEVAGDDDNQYPIGYDLTVPRFDENGNAYEYYVEACGVDDADKPYGGLVTDQSSMTTGTETGVFDFEKNPGEGGSLVKNVDLYFVNQITITVNKTVVDTRTNPATKEGWVITLTASDGTVYESRTTDANGQVKFENLPKKDANGNAITYTVGEDNSGRTDADLWTVTVSDNGTVQAAKGDATVTVTNTVGMGKITLVKVDADSKDVRINGAVYSLYRIEDGVKYWLTNDIDETTGMRAFTTDETKAAQFTTKTEDY